jgi:hypothetical protein
MHHHKPRLLRREWSLTKGGAQACCEVWSDGDYFEMRLVKSGDIMVREQARWDSELRLVQRGWREAMEAQGWTRDDGVSGRARVRDLLPKAAPGE